jgi:hypothetical protein
VQLRAHLTPTPPQVDVNVGERTLVSVDARFDVLNMDHFASFARRMVFSPTVTWHLAGEATVST